MTVNKFLFLFILFFNTSILFGYTDSDLDGVDDKIDKCKNTPLSDLVDKSGCSIKSLISPHKFSLIFGISHAQDISDNEKLTVITNLLQLNHTYKNISFLISSSNFNTTTGVTTSSGYNDTQVGAKYKFNVNTAFQTLIGISAVLPTYKSTLNNNKTDFQTSINLLYNLNKINFFTGYSYTIINDTNIKNVVTYNDTNSYSAGVGYYLNNNFYISMTYLDNSSVYVGDSNTQSISTLIYYKISDDWFVMYSYLNELNNDNNSYNSLKFGYSF